MSKEHRFELIATIDNNVITLPDPDPIEIKVGDTVRYSSPNGYLMIVWHRNVFDRQVSTTDDVLTVVSPGPFRGQCTFERPDGSIIGWTGQGPSWRVKEHPPTTDGQAETGEQGGTR